MGVPGFDWGDLAFFLELARQGRLVPAARRLRADHTTVSRRVAELERALHCSCSIAVRTASCYRRRPEAVRLRRVIESNATAIAENVGGIATAPSGDVRVATMEGIGSFYIAPSMWKLRQAFPALRVELVTERHLINLTKREADISSPLRR